jgi:uncharacterized protein
MKKQECREPERPNALKKPPDGWECGLMISRVPKNGSPHREAFDLPLNGVIEHWGQEYTPRSALSAEVEATFANERILTLVSVRANFSLPCSRCLRETGLAIIGNLRYLFTLRPSKDDDSEDNSGADDDGDVDVIPVDAFQAELDMRQYIWEVLLLNLPERVLCAVDCKGLCPICGRDKNEGDCDCREDGIDPRLEILRNAGV